MTFNNHTGVTTALLCIPTCSVSKALIPGFACLPGIRALH